MSKFITVYSDAILSVAELTAIEMNNGAVTRDRALAMDDATLTAFGLTRTGIAEWYDVFLAMLPGQVRAAYPAGYGTIGHFHANGVPDLQRHIARMISPFDSYALVRALNAVY